MIANENWAIWEKEKFENWRNFRPPWRPSAGDIENYKKGASCCRNQSKNALILGATPELRVLAAGMGFRIFVADYSLKMISEMANLAAAINPKKESLIVDNWCNINFQKYKPDLIFGDLILRLLSPLEQRKLLRNLCLSLKNNSILLTRVHFVNQALAKKSSQAIIGETISRRGKNLDKYYFAGLLISRLLDKFSLNNCKQIRGKAILEIKKYFQQTKSVLEKSILRIALSRLSLPGVRFYPQSKVEIERVLGYYFLINRKFVAEDYDDAEFFPIYQLKSKNSANI